MTNCAIALVALLSLAPALRADTYPRQPGVDVLEYVFRLQLSDDTDAIAGLTTVDLLLRAAGTAELTLDLVTDTGAGPGMRVDEVWVAIPVDVGPLLAPEVAAADRGAPVEWSHIEDRLAIALPAGLAAGTRVLVTIAYGGVPAAGLRIGPDRHGNRSFFSDDWPNKARNWLPTIDHPYEKARAQMVIDAPAHYQVIANGLLTEETDLGEGRRRSVWRQGVPIASWLYVLGVARFAVQHLEPFDGKPVQTWVQAADRDAGFYDFAVPTHDVLEFYSRNVGPYAYEKLANVQSSGVAGGGMESASAIGYSADSVTGTRSVRWRNVIIHEIAHQWFGNAVTEADWDDVWLSEGFATYFTLLYREHAYGRDDFVAGLGEARQRVIAFYADRPGYRVVHDNLDDMSQVTTGMQYQKGAWVLHMLRELIGTEDFWDGIRAYYAEHFNGSATTADFRRAMETASGLELGWFFEQWLYRGDMPEVTATLEAAPGGAGAVLVVRQQQAGEPMRLQVRVDLLMPDGSTQRHTVDLDGPESRVTLETMPEGLRLDPDTSLLARMLDGDAN